MFFNILSHLLFWKLCPDTFSFVSKVRKNDLCAVTKLVLAVILYLYVEGYEIYWKAKKKANWFLSSVFHLSKDMGMLSVHGNHVGKEIVYSYYNYKWHLYSVNYNIWYDK